MRKIGLFGGTFDPIHIGHLIIAEEVRRKLSLSEVWFIPSYVPPHKRDAVITPEHRLKMVELAIQSNKHFKVIDIELKRKGKSYTLDTMKQLKEDYPDEEFYFIIGADMVEYLPNWYKIDELIRLVQFVGVKRSGYKLESAYPVKEVEVPLIEISSTELRKRLGKGESTYYWIPEEVRQYIREMGLYES
jgi:nicotinate-nucleotide adenylyltransferase